MEKVKISKSELMGLTFKERLFVTGLIKDFNQAKENDKIKAREILREIFVDEESIKQLVK